MHKIGEKVYWNWSVAGTKGKGRVEGTVIEHNPRIAPGAKYRIRTSNGKEYMPVLKVHKLKKVGDY